MFQQHQSLTNIIPFQSTIDSCSNRTPCGDHGDCVDNFNAHACRCHQHYTGSNCSHIVNATCALKPPPCVNGTCTDLNETNKVARKLR